MIQGCSRLTVASTCAGPGIPGEAAPAITNCTPLDTAIRPGRQVLFCRATG